ncbi:DUF350 domain-containing protein [Paenibacillus sp. sgz500958]|uniref:DUF350 domain-containing protein n=1 Tax=Paenibacillus sp. sgz500958 TaxID=3242475 RepID=UPI0036D316E9
MVDIHVLVSMIVWTACGSALLFVLMYVDSLFTRYNDMEEMRNGNMAVTTRLVLKLLGQAYIMASCISSSSKLSEAMLFSVITFILLLILDRTVRSLLSRFGKLDLDHGAQQGKIGYGLFSGTLHIAGALIISAFL